MLKLKWFLVGVVATMFVVDWVRLRTERTDVLQGQEEMLRLLEVRSNQTTRCMSTLQKGRQLLDSANIAFLARVQTIDMMNKNPKDTNASIKDFNRYQSQLEQDKSVFDFGDSGGRDTEIQLVQACK